MRRVCLVALTPLALVIGCTDGADGVLRPRSSEHSSAARWRSAPSLPYDTSLISRYMEEGPPAIHQGGSVVVDGYTSADGSSYDPSRPRHVLSGGAASTRDVAVPVYSSDPVRQALLRRAWAPLWDMAPRDAQRLELQLEEINRRASDLARDRGSMPQKVKGGKGQ